MKIVFLGNFEVPYSSENHHAASLEALGHTVQRLQEQKPVNQLSELPDLFVWVHTHGWSTPGIVEIIHELKATNVPIISYHLDLWLGLEREQDLHNDIMYSFIDHWFVTDKLMADWLNKHTEITGHYLPAGVYDQECYISDEQTDYANDIIFVGSKRYHPEYPYRSQLIDWLKATYGNQFTHVGGDGDTGTIRGHELNKVYAQSKIAIGDSLNIGFNYPYYWSDRLYESMGRGGFTIFPYIQGIEDSFEDGRDLVLYEFGDFKDLQKKIDYYLDNHQQRERIRRLGHEKVKTQHTYKHRWQTIMEVLDGLHPRASR